MPVDVRLDRDGLALEPGAAPRDDPPPDTAPR
jgi:hypothetical protein